MNSIKIELKGLKGVKKALKAINKASLEGVKQEFEATGQDIVREAKTSAPTDEGHLRNSISHKVSVDGKGVLLEIIVATDYAAYVEFGTRKFAAKYVSTLPPDWQTFAAQYRGPGGGTLSEMLVRLQAWVMRKGFAAKQTKSGNRSKSASSLKQQEQAAYNIAIHILLVGVKPHPFLFPAVQRNTPLLIQRLNTLFGK